MKNKRNSIRNKMPIGTRVKCTQANFGGFYGQSGEVVAVHNNKIKVLMDSCKEPNMNESEKLINAYWFFPAELTIIEEE